MPEKTNIPITKVTTHTRTQRKKKKSDCGVRKFCNKNEAELENFIDVPKIVNGDKDRKNVGN